MDNYVWWFVVGFALVIAELLTGTFYLLVIAIAFGAAGLGALLGAPVVMQWAIAAAVALGGTLWLRQSRFGQRLRDRATSDRVQNMDVGQTLRVDQWAANRTARANYRGATWDVELAPGEAAAAGEFVIREIQANRLIVAAKMH
ncbi:MAG TPA: NfeD family protein [Burkholderiaceae bacterium]|jgi:membrane protein implicated in regulation of membrane protease activity|nr:NfeD family protein [Burkholderiaceae bacterium]